MLLLSSARSRSLLWGMVRSSMLPHTGAFAHAWLDHDDDDDDDDDVDGAETIMIVMMDRHPCMA